MLEKNQLWHIVLMRDKLFFMKLTKLNIYTRLILFLKNVLQEDLVTTVNIYVLQITMDDFVWKFVIAVSCKDTTVTM